MSATVAAALEERDRELEAVGGVLAAARAGAGGALLVEGPPGIGKTRLLAAARAAAGDDVRVLSARGSELERDFPFAVVRQLLEPALEPELLVGAAALAAPVLEDSAAQAGPAALHGLYWLTANLAARAPLLVLVDDLHWADLASLRWLAYLVQRIDGLACAVVAGSRPTEDGHGEEVLDVLATHPDVDVLHPGGLSAAAVARIIERGLGEPDRAFAAACREVSGGNPFLLGELLRELSGVAPTAENAGLVARQTSRTVSRAALARLRRLPPAATALANATVVLGDCAELHLAASLAELAPGEAAEAADALVAASIFAPGKTARRSLVFAHPLVCASIGAELGPGERSQLHGRAAALLAAAGRPAERVAVHVHQCDPAGDAEAVRVLRDAAAEARRRGDTEVAASHLQRALREPPAPAEEPRVRRELGLAELDDGESAHAAEHLAAAVTGLADPADRARTAMRLGLALQLCGRPEDAVGVLNDAIAALPAAERELGLLLQAVAAARRRATSPPRHVSPRHASQPSSTSPARSASGCSPAARRTARRRTARPPGRSRSRGSARSTIRVRRPRSSRRWRCSSRARWRRRRMRSLR